MNKNAKEKVLVWGSVVTILLAVFVIWSSFKPMALDSVKDISVTVIHSDGTELSRDIRTTARTLSEALESQGLIVVDDWGLGPFILEADGEVLDGSTGQFWTFAVDGVGRDYDVDTQPVEDEDAYYIYPIVY